MRVRLLVLSECVHAGSFLSLAGIYFWWDWSWSLPILLIWPSATCLVAVMFLHQGPGGLSSCCVGAPVHRWGVDCPEIRLPFSVGRGGGAAQTTHWVRSVKLELGSQWGCGGCKYTKKRSWHTHLNWTISLCLYALAWCCLRFGAN